MQKVLIGIAFLSNWIFTKIYCQWFLLETPADTNFNEVTFRLIDWKHKNYWFLNWKVHWMILSNGCLTPRILKFSTIHYYADGTLGHSLKVNNFCEEMPAMHQYKKHNYNLSTIKINICCGRWVAQTHHHWVVAQECCDSVSKTLFLVIFWDTQKIPLAFTRPADVYCFYEGCLLFTF